MTSRSPYLLLIVFLFAPGMVHGASVSAPYAIDFSTFAAGDTPIPNVTESPSDKWTITADHKYRVFDDVVSASVADRSAALNITNLFGRDFEISTRFKLAQFPANIPANYQAQIGLGAFADSTSFADTSGSKYRLMLLLTGDGAGETGQLTLIENDSTGVFHMYSGDTLPIAAGTTYDMTLRGHAHDGNLDLTGIASNGIKTISLLLSDDNTPRTGKNFGLTASAFGSAGTTFSADFTQLTVIPEPTMVIGLLPMFCLGRRSPNRKGRGMASPMN